MISVYVLIAILGAVAMAFAVQNPDPVTISFLSSRTVSLPLCLLLPLSVFVGVVFASVSGFALSAPRDQIPRVERGLAPRAVPKV